MKSTAISEAMVRDHGKIVKLLINFEKSINQDMKTMKKRTAYQARAIAAEQNRQERTVRFALTLLVTGLLIGQLLLLISP